MAKGKYEYWLSSDGLLLLEAWARDGLTDEQIAHNVGISRKTLAQWKTRFSIIGDTLKVKKEIADIEVENALRKRALGFKYDEKTYERVWNDKFEKYIKVNTKIVTKMVVPDVTAQIYWLKNRKPDKWRDRPAEEDKTALETLDNILKSVNGMMQQ
jgi:DNA-binding XRE family transcriptional regulator